MTWQEAGTFFSLPCALTAAHALPGCGASLSRCASGPPDTHTTGTSDQTLSWSVSTGLSSRRCPAEKATPRPRAARSQRTAGEGKEPTGGEPPAPGRRHRSLGRLEAAPGRRLLSWEAPTVSAQVQEVLQERNPSLRGPSLL